MAGSATQVFSREFDLALSRLPTDASALVLRKINELGARLDTFPHYRMTGRTEYRLRVGDYRIIYEFDRNQLYLITLGHRREVYH